MRTVAILMLAAAAANAQQLYKPTEENLKARTWFQDSKFGMFIHWGVYSVLGDGEWVMNNRKMSIEEYEKLAGQFNPTEFDPAEWVALANQAGMKYITFTSKHHDGFAMWETQQSNWNIAAATPYKKDIVKMLAEECHKQGIKLFLYHSQLDWHHPDYYPLGTTGHNSGRQQGGDFSKYVDYMDSQLRELLTNYGELGGIWFDGWWDKPGANWRLERTYAMIHQLQPAALVGSNHHRKPLDGEDFQMFEKDLPGQNTSGFSAEASVSALPLETCDTINRAWGYNAKDKRFKSTKELMAYLVRAAGHNANFLLNVGPMPTGKIQPEFQERLKEIGEWMAKNGESIYGTRGGPITPRPWGATTQTEARIYVHVLDWQDKVLALPDLGKVKSARLMGGREVELAPLREGYALYLPEDVRDPLDTVVVLEKAQ